MDWVLTYEERVVLGLRALYGKYGYQPYRMSKFEEYDLYAENRRFLASNGIITFTGANGALMALKPDVTLSIIKNYKETPGATTRVCYDENVYRATGESREFREITQTGLECIGELDAYNVAEVVLLAIESLSRIHQEYVLDICHTGILEGMMNEGGLNAAARSALRTAIESKNAVEITSICAKEAVPDGIAKALGALTTLYGPLGEAIPRLRELCAGGEARGALAEIETLYGILAGCGMAGRVRWDFSMESEPEYYDGVIFKGFVADVPAAVLSGGRYDRLMEKLGKRSGAIGFAVYMNLLEQLNEKRKEYDADVLLLYAPGEDPLALAMAARAITAGGRSVLAQKSTENAIRCREQVRFGSGEAKNIAEDA